MNVKRVLSSLLAAAVLMGLMALPAVANPVPLDPANATGTFAGDAKVGKIRTFCTHEGDSDVTGPGIGTPLNNGKNAYWSIVAPVIPGGKPLERGLLKACGRLEPMFSNLSFPSKQGDMRQGLGAACGASKGNAGKGTLFFPTKPAPNKIYLRNIGWKVSTGGAFTVTGEALTNQSKGKTAVDGFVAEVEAVPDLTGEQGSCTGKTNPTKQPSDGVRGFDVVGTYTLVPGGGDLDDTRNMEQVDVDPDGSGPLPRVQGITCKETGNPNCLYKTKKDPQKS